MRVQRLIVSCLPTLAIGLRGDAVAQDPGGSRAAISLKEAVDGRFEVEVGVSEQLLADPRCAALIERNFERLTPENCMKPQEIHPTVDGWNFDAADRFVAFAKTHDSEVLGNCLVWAKDDRTDDWMKHRTNDPLLFDRELNPKEVCHRVTGVLAEIKGGHAARERND